MTKTFASNPDVVFMDVNLSEERIMEAPNGDSYSPGAGGWPTIRYFNRETGISGGAYQKKTGGHMCDELGDDSMMEAYVEEYANTSMIMLCSVTSEQGCDEREIGFIAKSKNLSLEDQKAYVERLIKMEGSSMKPELSLWIKKRKQILKQLVSAAAGGDEDEL